MTGTISYEEGVAVLRDAWSNASILEDERQGSMFAIRNMRFHPDHFERILKAMRAMPSANEQPTLDVVQLVWRIPAQMMLYREYFPEHQPKYDLMALDALTEASRIIGVQLGSGA